MGGLLDKVVRARFQCSHLGVEVGRAGEHEDGHRTGGRPLAQLPAHLKARHVRQAQVENDRFGGVLGRQAQGFFAQASDRHMTAPPPKHPRQSALLAEVVFHQEHLGARESVHRRGHGIAGR